MDNQTISIAAVLSLIDTSVMDGVQTPFTLEFVKEDGSIGKIVRAVRSHKASDQNHPQLEGSRFKYSVKEREVVMLHNLDGDNPRTRYRAVKFRKIIRFNGIPVIH